MQAGRGFDYPYPHPNPADARLPPVRKGSILLPSEPYLPGKPCRAGDIGSRPQAAKRGRAMRAGLYRMAPVWPHGAKRVTVLVMFIAPW
jgi:hypothetical protein